MLAPPDVGHEPHNPVRDDSKLAPDEDLDREPDGVPHRIVGLTALFSVLLAALLAGMFIGGGTTTRVCAAIIAVLAIPTIVATLNRRSQETRDHLHPSR